MQDYYARGDDQQQMASQALGAILSESNSLNSRLMQLNQMDRDQYQNYSYGGPSNNFSYSLPPQNVSIPSQIYPQHHGDSQNAEVVMSARRKQ